MDKIEWYISDTMVQMDVDENMIDGRPTWDIDVVDPVDYPDYENEDS